MQDHVNKTCLRGLGTFPETPTHEPYPKIGVAYSPTGNLTTRSLGYSPTPTDATISPVIPNQ
jgi:hypothetical protein